mmetsp:Transcript_36843/g.33078  ORF Transcript_36843/g.33078 Transcript_36843/m.33078 type:complete len:160 (+) Transcript_36843:163-642(+)
MCTLFCCIKNARTVPTNYILLGIFTLCESYLVAWLASFYSPTDVILAAALTVSLTFVLTVYACTTKTDFTLYGGILFILGWALFAFGFLFCWVSFGSVQSLNTAIIIYSVLGVCLYGVYLIYDTQLIMGGKRYKLDLDDYVIGALCLYLDIIIIFIKLL